MNGLAKLLWVAALAAAPDEVAHGWTSQAAPPVALDAPHVTALATAEVEVMVSGDFDGDGYDDLAVGAPKAGMVQLYRGTARGLVVWKLLDESDFIALGATVGKGDRFGAALGAGRYFSHANPLVHDLIIGAPGAHAGAGAAFVYKGDVATLYFANPAPSADHFGSAVAIGDLGQGPALAVGAPNAASHGMAYVRHAGDGAWTTFDPGHAAAGTHYGAALSIDHTLAIGAPGSATVPGAVWTYNATFVATGTLAAPHPKPGDAFGTALASGIVALGQDRLVVGAPNAGMIALYDRSTTPYTRTQTFDESSIPGMPHAPDDRFGAALAIADLDGDQIGDIAIGAPGESVVGFVHGSDLTGWRWSAGKDDAYGTAVAMGFFRNGPTAEIAIAARDTVQLRQ
jgi:FG-GAP repeat